MDIKEFNDLVRPFPHCDDQLILDVRPFGGRQGEAVDSYLHSRLMHVNTTGIGNTDRLVELICDAAAEIPESAKALIEILVASGQFAEIRRASATMAFDACA